jgi:hypothetical protein
MRPTVRLAAALLAVVAILGASPAMAIEEPLFTVVEKDDRFELRDYAPMIVAETVVDGDMSTASNRGFRAIAGYIFGGNRSVSGGASEKIEMTVPVTLEPASERIAMTAPVVVEPQDGGAARWKVRFVMPRAYTLATLPTPNDPSVVLREIPGARRAVVVFSGLAGDGPVRRETDALLAWIAARGLAPTGPPQLSRYDPPWKLPFMRRNEVWVDVAAR